VSGQLGLSDFFGEHGGIKVVIFAGKGGLGKTTCSAALAYHLAVNEGRRVLCFSTDPQASLSDIFERDLFGKGIIEVAKNLHVVEIDADKRIAEYQEEIRRKIKEMYGLDEIPKEIDEYISSTSAEPAMYESATYDAMAELVAEGDFDIYIFDMPPFGHGVRMVAMAEILTTWVEKLAEAREEARKYEAVAASLRGSKVSEDEILNELISIRDKMKAFTDLLVDTKKTAFFMVLVPESMAILDTERALNMFNDLGINLSGVVVNRVYPKHLLDDPTLPQFLRNKILEQDRYLGEIKEKFSEYIVSVIPAYEREPKGLDMLEVVSKDLMYSKISL
jgi:arsenite-transporting ATPase